MSFLQFIHINFSIAQNFILFKSQKNAILLFLYGFVFLVSCGKDSSTAEGGHWTERSEGSGWSDSGTLDSLFLTGERSELSKAARMTKKNLKLVHFILY